MQEEKARLLLSSIKGTAIQLQGWKEVQENFRRKRVKAKASSLHGRLGRVEDACYRAKHAFPQEQDPSSAVSCSRCDSDEHSTAECDSEDCLGPLSLSFEEAPGVGIHRGIVHRLFEKSCELYELLYPRFYPGPPTGVLRSFGDKTLPIPLTGPDYFSLSIQEAASSVQATTSSHDKEQVLRTISQLYYSPCFPASLETFRERVKSRILADQEE
jgi:hypothetical protein